MALKYLYAPSGVKAGKAYGVLPNSASADFSSFVSDTDGTRVDENGFITDVEANVPRIDYTGGGCPSLLLEPQSTNLFQYSEDFSQSYWVRTGSYDIVYENKLNPKGELGYYKLTGSGQLRKKTISVGTSVNDFTLSILVKNIDSDSIRLDFSDSSSGDAYIDFFFATETFGTPVNGGAWTNAKGSFIKLKNGWYYVSLTATKNAGDNVISKIIYENDSVALFAAQAEQQSYATSYIPNYGTAAGVTRSADVGGSTGDLSSVINSTEGTFMIEAAYLDSVLNRISLNNAATTSANRITILADNTRFNVFYYVNNVGGSGLMSTSDLYENSKIAIRWKNGSITGYLNGTEGFTATNIGEFPTGILDRITLGISNGTAHFKGQVKQLRVYDEYLSDSEMAQLTTL